MQLKLNQFPRAIAKAEADVLSVQTEIAIVVDQLASRDADIEKAIATNEALKNDQQRKAFRIDSQREYDYIALQTDLKDLKFKQAKAEIDLNQLQNEFSVAKLEARLQIAHLEQIAA
jgi:hypothetical protein